VWRIFIYDRAKGRCGTKFFFPVTDVYEGISKVTCYIIAHASLESSKCEVFLFSHSLLDCWGLEMNSINVWWKRQGKDGLRLVRNYISIQNLAALFDCVGFQKLVRQVLQTVKDMTCNETIGKHYIVRHFFCSWSEPSATGFKSLKRSTEVMFHYYSI